MSNRDVFGYPIIDHPKCSHCNKQTDQHRAKDRACKIGGGKFGFFSNTKKYLPKKTKAHLNCGSYQPLTHRDPVISLMLSREEFDDGFIYFVSVNGRERRPADHLSVRKILCEYELVGQG